MGKVIKKIFKGIGIAVIGIVVLSLVFGGGEEDKAETTNKPAVVESNTKEEVAEKEEETVAVEQPKLEVEQPKEKTLLEKKAEELDAMPTFQRKCANKALSYLSNSGFSKERLRGQLEYEKFEQADIDAAIEFVDSFVDWNKEAIEKANSYMKSSNMSRSRLYDQLIFEKFTPEQAQYAIDNLE